MTVRTPTAPTTFTPSREAPAVDAWRDVIARALAEDRAFECMASEWGVPRDTRAIAELRIKADGIACGLDGARMTFEEVSAQMGVEYRVETPCRDGRAVARGEVAQRWRGDAQAILRAERIALNLLGRLSGIATLTARYVAEVVDTNARILDTRKTTPGLRAIEKWAVACGGGYNHRHDLAQLAMLKDTHLVAGGGLDATVARFCEARAASESDLALEVEVASLAELDRVLEYPVQWVMLDNFADRDLDAGVAMVRARRPDVVIEASGGITLERVRRVALSGVDYISVGALTHSAPMLDVSLDLRVAHE